MTFTNKEFTINGGKKKVIGIVVNAEVDNNGMWYDKLGEEIVMLPLNSYDSRTGEPPTIRGYPFSKAKIPPLTPIPKNSIPDF